MLKRFKDFTDFNDFHNKVEEGLIVSYPIITANKIITREFIYQKIKNKSIISGETIFIKCLSVDLVDKDYLKLFNQCLLCGYFISTIDFYDNNDVLINTIPTEVMSQKFLDKINDNVNNSEFAQFTIEQKFNSQVVVPQKLYHLTNVLVIDKIKKKGLIPKSKNKKAYHTDRIYFGFDPYQIKNLANQFGVGKWALLEIDTIGLTLNLYNDPDFIGYGYYYYIYDNIPPTNIKIITVFEVK